MCSLLPAGAGLVGLIVAFAACGEIPSEVDRSAPGAPKLASQTKTVCELPEDHVILGWVPSRMCGRNLSYAMYVGIPGIRETVCDGVPPGYVIVAHYSYDPKCRTDIRVPSHAQLIKLPSNEEWVCGVIMYAPGNYQIVRSGTLSACGPTYTTSFNARLVRWTRKYKDQGPVGKVEDLTPDRVVYGWVCQPDHPALNTEVHLYATGSKGSPKLFATFRTRMDVEWALADRCNGYGTYRFRQQITSQQLATLGRGTYKISVQAADIDDGLNVVISSGHQLVVK